MPRVRWAWRTPSRIAAGAGGVFDGSNRDDDHWAAEVFRWTTMAHIARMLGFRRTMPHMVISALAGRFTGLCRLVRQDGAISVSDPGGTLEALLSVLLSICFA